MSSKKESFSSEAEIQSVFKAEPTIMRRLHYNGWKSWEVCELAGLFGVPDNLLVLWKPTKTGNLVLRTFAFELKREKWRKALMQAYRYKAFADYSFVVMDAAFVHRPATYIEEFKRANVGLLAISTKGEVAWYHLPSLRKPYSESAKNFLQNTVRSYLFDEPIPKEGPTIKWASQKI